jgi:hypothetical protein
MRTLSEPPVRTPAGRIYVGTVVHMRLRPRPHKLAYRVFSLLLDVDRIDEAMTGCRWLSRNRFNLLSYYDADHGEGGDTPIATQARALFSAAGFALDGCRIELLAYPRVLGYVFNPISVYYLIDPSEHLRAVAYEVNNTFREREVYVVAAGPPAGNVYAQGCSKRMYVSPFTSRVGRYGFRVTAPSEELLVGVQLHDPDGALLRTHFRATARPLGDRALLQAIATHPLMTLKVIAGIHIEALRLWLKGVPVVQRHVSPRYTITVVPPQSSSPA